MRATLLAVLAAAGALLLPLPFAGARTTARAPAVVDLRVHLPYQLVQRGRSLASGGGQASVWRLRRGGVVGVVLPFSVTRPRQRAVGLVPAYAQLHRHLRRSPDFHTPGCHARPTGKIQTWLATESAGRFATRPTEIGLWVTRGVRLFGLARYSDNAVATYSGTRAASGLTPAGEKVVRRIHAERAIVDVSHASRQTIDDVLRLALAASRPVVASHSNARAVSVHPRNLTDDQIRAIAKSGGVVGVSFEPRLLVRGQPARLKHVVQHVLHIARVGGVEHVAIGSGYAGGIRAPRGLYTASKLPRLARALEEAGMPRRDVRRVFSKNALRILCPP